MVDSLAERIRKMAELIEPEYIAASLKLPLEVVKGVLNGEIPDEVLEKYDPARPPEVRVVEKKQYVRNRTIAVYGPGGTGATTVAGMLALVLAGQKRTVCAVDLAEYAALGPFLGVDCWREKAVKYPNVLWLVGKAGELEVPTERETLKVVLGAASAKKHLEIDWERVRSWLEELARRHEILVLDLPRNLERGRPLVEVADCLILVLKSDVPGINALWQIKPLIDDYLHKTYVVFNKTEEFNLPPALKDILEYAAGRVYLPRDPRLKFDAFESSRTEFARCLQKGLVPLLGYGERRETQGHKEQKTFLGIFKIG